MGKSLDFVNYDEVEIAVERTGAWYKIARELGDFIKELPLSQPDNDRLVALMIEHMLEGERGAFHQGLRMGAELGKHLAEHPEE